jgi:hypothetical protein
MRASTVLLLTSLLGAPMFALGAPQDFSGVWSIVRSPARLTTVAGATPPLNAAGQAIYAKRRAAAARGDRSFDETSKCLPPGLPRLMLVNQPFEILQRDKVVYFIHQLNRLPRRAYFGEQLPDDPDPLYLGFSVARWEGATLVIESAGFREGTLLDDSGLPHSEVLHLTERYQLRAGGALHVRFTVDDPKTFTRPWDFQADYVKLPGYEIPEQVCSDKQAAATGSHSGATD